MIACNAKRVLELGTLGGYSTIWLARALPENGKVITIEVNTHYATIAGKNIHNAGLSERVEVITGNALNILEQFIADKVQPTHTWHRLKSSNGTEVMQVKILNQIKSIFLLGCLLFK